MRNIQKKIQPIRIHLDLFNHNTRAINRHRNPLIIIPKAVQPLDVNAPLQSIHRGDSALETLVGSSHDGDNVVLADGEGADLLHRVFVGTFSLFVAGCFIYWWNVSGT
jgi:hypothetical protein